MDSRGLTEMAARQSVTDKPARRQIHIGTAEEGADIWHAKKKSNLSMSIDQQALASTGYPGNVAAHWVNSNLLDGPQHDEEAFNMVRTSTKFQKMSQSIQLQSYQKYRSRLGVPQQFPFGEFESPE